MSKKIDLTKGSIFSGLLKLSIPIVGTSFIQMAYNLTDMLWIGRLGSNSVAAVGTAGFYMWLSMAFIMLSRTGTEIRVAQTTGEKNEIGAETYARQGIQLTIAIGILYSLFVILFKKQLIQLIGITDQGVNDMALSYLTIIAFGFIFTFCNQVFTGIFNGRGDSSTPFKINTIGLLFNIILDPILIFGIGVFPELGVLGAAIATIAAQGIVFAIFIYKIKFSHRLFKHFTFLVKPQFDKMKEVLKISFPMSVQSALFTIFSIGISRIVAGWGPMPIAVQKVGSQIESISWMTANGLSVSLATFVGQNYGAKQNKRVLQGYFVAIKTAFVLGIFTSLMLIFGAEFLMGLFFPGEVETIAYGKEYLQILGISQLAMCIEITTVGVFNGIGKTMYPAMNSILLTGARIPMAIILSQPQILGLNGVWWSVTITSVLKGIVIIALLVWYINRSNKFKLKDVFSKSLG